MKRSFKIIISLFVLLALQACSSMTPRAVYDGPAINPDTAAQTMLQYVTSYDSGDIHGFVDVFTKDAMHNGNRVAESKKEWKKYFSKTPSIHPAPKWEFKHIKIDPITASATAWFTEISDRPPCSGPYRIQFDKNSLIQSVESLCYDIPYEEAIAGVDPALLGQGADVASTGISLSQGLVEGNPVGGALGFPVFSLLKIGMTQHASNLSLRECKKSKTMLAATGWGASGWNICSLVGGVAAGPAGVVGCAAVAIGAGKVALDEAKTSSVMSCWAPLAQGAEYMLIDSSGIYER